MTRKILLEYKYESDFTAIGIYSPLKEYRMAWLMNQHLGFDMKLLPVFHWHAPDRDQQIPCRLFSYADPHNSLQVYLLNNRTAEGTLIRKPRNIDYLFLIKNPGQHIKIQQMTDMIRGINQVQMAVLLNEAPDKTALALYYDLEMFLTEA
ncbi:MAG: IPExxxVDY family protein [Bacteroidales bacterium]